jgi:hypothetical protein
MVALFSGAPVLIIAMAIAMESAKLVAAGWLARRWRGTAWLWRLVLVGLIAGAGRHQCHRRLRAIGRRSRWGPRFRAIGRRDAGGTGRQVG